MTGGDSLREVRLLAVLAMAAGLTAAAGIACRGNGGAPKPIGPGDAAGPDVIWRAIAMDGQPAAALDSAAVWTGSELVVWGGTGQCPPNGLCGTGARYRPAEDRWLPMASDGAPAPRALAAATWTGTAVAIWGGRGCGGPNGGCGDGALYDPVADRWVAMEAAGAPAARGWASAVWTGGEILIWGGQAQAGGVLLGDGGAYDPEQRRWTPMPAGDGAPSARRYHNAVWTGHEMIIWGGNSDALRSVAQADGAAYDPVTRHWRTLASGGAPSARWVATAVWTGQAMLVWGGVVCGPVNPGAAFPRCGDGGSYDPVADRWRPVGSDGAPTARSGHSMVWSGREALVWGGGGDRCTVGTGGLCADGSRFDPATARWTAIPAAAPADARAGHVAAWTGTELVVWGGTAPGEGEFPRFDGARIRLRE